MYLFLKFWVARNRIRIQNRIRGSGSCKNRTASATVHIITILVLLFIYICLSKQIIMTYYPHIQRLVVLRLENKGKQRLRISTGDSARSSFYICIQLCSLYHRRELSIRLLPSIPAQNLKELAGWVCIGQQ